MKEEIKVIRTGKTIKNVETGEVQQFTSISKAKKWSLVWQKANGGLGTAGLRVAR